MPSTLLSPQPQHASPPSGSHKHSIYSLFRSISQSKSQRREDLKISRPLSVPPPPSSPNSPQSPTSPSSKTRKPWGSISSITSDPDSQAYSTAYTHVSRPSLDAYSTATGSAGLHSRKPSSSSSTTTSARSTESTRPRPPSPTSQIDDLSLFSPFDPRPVPSSFSSSQRPQRPVSPPILITKSSIAKYQEPQARVAQQRRQTQPQEQRQQQQQQQQPLSGYQPKRYEEVPIAMLRRDSAQEAQDGEEGEQEHNTPLLPSPPPQQRKSRQIYAPGDGDGVRTMTVWERIGERRAKGAGGYVPEGW